MATTRVPYKGKKELTMAQFEALDLLDDAFDYDIVDFPNTGITNAQMTAALGYTRLFNAGDTFVCVDSGTYEQGHVYKVAVNGETKSWEDITPVQVKHSELKNADAGSTKEDTWTTDDIGTTLSVKHENGETQAGISVSKNYADMSSLSTGVSAGSSKVSVTSDSILLNAQSVAENVQNYVKIDANTTTFSNIPKVVTSSNGEQITSDVVIKDDLAGYVPTQSETTDGYYAQISNENGTVQITVSQNGQPPVHSLSISKDAVLVDGNVINTSGTQSDQPAVLYTEQTLTSDQQTQVCSNLDLEEKFVKAQTANAGEVKVYCINGTNPHDVCRVSNNGLAGAIARYGNEGRLICSVDPVNDDHLVRFGYFKNHVSKVYKHKIMLAISDSNYLSFVLFSDSSTPITKSTFLPTETSSKYMDLSARRQTTDTSTGYGVLGHLGNATSTTLEFIRYDGEKETSNITDSVTVADVVFEI